MTDKQSNVPTSGTRDKPEVSGSSLNSLTSDPVFERAKVHIKAPLDDPDIQRLVEELMTGEAKLDEAMDVLHDCLEHNGLSIANRRACIKSLMILQAKKRYIEDSDSPYDQPFNDIRSLYLNSSNECDLFVAYTNLAAVLIEGYEVYDQSPEAEYVLAILQQLATSDSISQDNSLCHLLIQLISVMPIQIHSDDMIALIIQLMSLVPFDDVQRSHGFNTLYHILCIRFQAGERDSSLQDDHFEKFYELSEILQLRGEMAESSIDLDAAITSLRAASFIPPPETANYVKANRLLGAWLLARYERYNNITDFNDGVKATMTMERKYDENLLNMSRRLLSLFRVGLDEQGLVDEVALHNGMLLSQPLPHPDRAETLLKLGSSLSLLFKINGNIRQLHLAIMHLRAAAVLDPQDGVIAIALALALTQKLDLKIHTPEVQFDKLIERSLEFEEILALFYQGTLMLPFNLASFYKVVNQKMTPESLTIKNLSLKIQNLLLNIQDPPPETGLSNINTELRAFRKQMLTALRYFHPFTVNALDEAVWKAEALRSVFSITGDLNDLDESINFGRKALIMCDENSGGTAFFNVGEALYTRYRTKSEMKDLDEALTYIEKSLILLPINNFHRAQYLTVLGIALIDESFSSRWQETSDEISEAEMNMVVYIIQLFKAAATETTYSPIADRFEAAALWAASAEHWNFDDILLAYETAIGFLPKLSSVGSKHSEMQGNLQAVSKADISLSASLYVIKNGNYGKAIEFLETGRAIFWQQVLMLRTPTHSLKETSPELYEQFCKLSAELERSTLNKETQSFTGNADRLKHEEHIVHLGHLNEQWDKVLRDIQSLEGFRDFLSPQSLSNLQKNSKHPVIYLIPDEYESHALILRQNDVTHVLLPEAPYSRLQSMISRLPRANATESLKGDNIIESRGGQPAAAVRVDPLKLVLEFLWKDVVSHIIRSLDYSKGLATKNRVFWCPTGVFSFLPLHAAGVYGEDMSSIDSTFDYVISSYTPTAGAIIKDRPVAELNSDEASFKMMVVIDPTLECAKKEMNIIEKHIPSELLRRYGTADSPALVNEIASNLPGISIVHFACHGKQFTYKPLNSFLKLHDGDLTISHIMEKQIQNASLVFLSACETAKGDIMLPDEVIHLGSTLLFSGFKSVVATMWSIRDDDGPVVADKFYKHLLKGNSKIPNTEFAAEAVHVATAELRSHGVDFWRWVPFIHLGN